MQIDSANLLALQQAQAKAQTKPAETADFAATLAAAPEQSFESLFPESEEAVVPASDGGNRPPLPPAAPQPPGTQVDIKV